MADEKFYAGNKADEEDSDTLLNLSVQVLFGGYMLSCGGFMAEIVIHSSFHVFYKVHYGLKRVFRRRIQNFLI